ncbi:MAG: FAD-dependent oxidoreductase [Opitutaceae bacterium]
MTTERYDLAVIGGGSGGFGAALAAAREGCRVILIERAPTLGGNAARGGVNCWEPGAGGTGFPFEIYKHLKKMPRSVGIYTHRRHMSVPVAGQPIFPGGEQVIDPDRRYVDSLRRFAGKSVERDWAFTREHCHGVPFEPAAYERVIGEMLAETGRVTTRVGTAFTTVEVSGRRITSIGLDSGEVIEADTFIDATADIHLAAMAGCQTQLGQEARSVYQEPSAPEKPTDRLNAVTLIYRVDPRTDGPGVDPLPDGIAESCWWRKEFPVAACNEYPAGGWNINMLPTMEGLEAWRLGPDRARLECRRRVIAHWHHFQTVFPEWRHYRLTWIAPALGVRETRRLVGRHVLTEHDLDATLKSQTHPDLICIADHPKDVHGEARQGMMKEVSFPYGVPFRCLLPKEFDNLAVACRGASFSSIGASSCRLSRTMMQLGQAAGTAAAIARRHRISISDTPVRTLRETLQARQVQLTWPAPAGLQAYLEAEDA